MSKRISGFTIVELLIVIVVIAILAAITIVAFNGIQERARASEVSSALSQVKKKIGVWQVDNPDTTPPNLAAAEVTNSGNVSYQYKPGTNGAYCITATSGSTSYKITNTTNPEKGGCPGHGQGGNVAITNFSLNPSVETNITNYNGPNGSTLAQSSTRAQTGQKSILVTMPSGANGSTVGVNTTAGHSIGTALTANTAYTFSAWVYVPSGTVNLYVSAQGSTTGSNCNTSTTISTKDSWVRVSCNFTTTASGTPAIYILNGSALSSQMTFYVDSVMITSGTTLYNYADGDSQDWTWNNTANNSTSTGPAL